MRWTRRSFYHRHARASSIHAVVERLFAHRLWRDRSANDGAIISVPAALTRSRIAAKELRRRNESHHDPALLVPHMHFECVDTEHGAISNQRRSALVRPRHSRRAAP